MELWLVGVERASKDNKEWLQCYGQTCDGTRYGPFRIYMGNVWVSKNAMWYSDAKAMVARLSPEFGKSNCKIKPYGAKQWVIWVYTFDEAKDTRLYQGFSQYFYQITLSDRVWPRVELPEHKIVLQPLLAEIFEMQRSLHQKLGVLRDNVILPLLAHGMSLEDCLRWLKQEKKDREALAKNIKANVEKRKQSYDNVPDEYFLRDTTGEMNEITAGADNLEGKLRVLHEQNFLQRCWEDTQNNDPFRTILYLTKTNGIRHGIARLFE